MLKLWGSALGQEPGLPLTTPPHTPHAAPAIEENQAVLDPDQPDIHQDVPQADPTRPAARGSNSPPQSLLPLFQEETPRATRTTIAAPPAMTSSASKGAPPPRGGG